MTGQIPTKSIWPRRAHSAAQDPRRIQFRIKVLVRGEGFFCIPFVISAPDAVIEVMETLL